MDPFAAVSFCCNVLDLTDRSIKVYKTFKLIYNSADGHDHVRLQQATQNLREIVKGLKDNRSQLAQTGDASDNDATSTVLSKIDKISEALEGVLEECKAEKPKRYRAAIKALWKSWWSQDELDKYEAQLKRCQQDLNTLLAVDASGHFRKILGFLRAAESARKEDRAELEMVLEKLTKNTESKTSEILEQLRLGRDISTKATENAYAKKILKALGRPGDRYEEVQEAAEHTFEWLFDDSNGTSGKHGDPVSGDLDAKPARADAAQAHASKQFKKWLTEGTGIFHVSGKPGAGKSTLMKYITEHKATESLLLEWTGPQRLILTKYFFWRAGDWRQNTLKGLVQSLLYEILSKAPNLIPTVFPPPKPIENIQHLDSTWKFSSLDLSYTDCRRALGRLVEEQTLMDGIRICLFIDGLDEFAEHHGNESHEGLVRILRQWAENSNGRTKLCVSSRELPVFNDISPENKVRLQDLTRSDIYTYVQDTLMEHSAFLELRKTAPEPCDSLTKEITQNANGVFLWVVLVTQSVLRGLSNRDSITILSNRVQGMPDGLDDLFDKILNSIEKCYLYEVTLILAIVMRLHGTSLDGRAIKFFKLWEGGTAGQWLSLLSVYLVFKALDIYPSPGLAFRQFNIRKIGDISDELVHQTYHQIAGRFNGLLTVHTVQARSLRYPAVGLTHRSIIEFMEKRLPTIAKDIGLSDSDVGRAMCWTFNAEIIHTDMYDCSFYCQTWDQQYKRINVPRCTLTENRWDSKSIRLICCLKPWDGSISDEILKLIDDIDRTLLKWTKLPVDDSDDFWKYGYRRFCFRESDCPTISFLLHACYLGFNQYVAWRLNHDPPLVHGSHKEKCLLLSIFSDPVDIQPGAVETLQILLKNGVDANCAVPKDIIKENENEDKSSSFLWTDAEVSFFDYVWVQCVAYLEVCSEDWSLLEEWIRYGAEPRACATKKVVRSGHKYSLRWHVSDGSDYYSDESCPPKSILEYFNELPPEDYDELKPRDFELARFDGSNTFTFEDIIKIYNPPNRDSILALLHDQKSRHTTETHNEADIAQDTSDISVTSNEDRLIEYPLDDHEIAQEEEQPQHARQTRLQSKQALLIAIIVIPLIAFVLFLMLGF
ncbi:hypothetical protein F5B20DRAFT_579972 [Whalleya microplaca]|nr:hypothetical protein F5B20DRAFT_579972 [Whalleya microplaca]